MRPILDRRSRPVLDSIRSALTRRGRLVIVSNRLPMTVSIDDGGVNVLPSAGGLATGLRGIHERSHGLWIGWPGTDALTDTGRETIRARLADDGAVPVFLDADEMASYYGRVSNGALWPVLHDRAPDAEPSADDWRTYREVNERFADIVATHVRPGDQVWVHDYHLMLLPRMLRERCPELVIGFFLHTPFPSPSSFAALSRAPELLHGLLGADVIGMHTTAYVDAFAEATGSILGRSLHDGTIADGSRQVRLQACPMSIDARAFATRAESSPIAPLVDRLRGDGGPLLVGVDRLDYTKGIPERLLAFARLLERRPELRGHARLFQLAIPSRDGVPAYQALRARVESLVAEINDWFRTACWTPIEYVHGTVGDEALSAIYRAADVMLVTPLRDGMNLVAKEFVASRTDDDGVLVLSTQAGAAAELRAALLVDPTDVESLATTIEAAMEMPRAERRVRMRRLRRGVARHDVFQWARQFLLALGSEHSAMVGRPAGA